MSRKFAVIAALTTASLAAATVSYLHWGSSWHAFTMSSLGLFASEADAAYHGSESVPASPPIATLAANEPVAVLWDKYGKDYWACYVRTQSNARGWVLCTSLTKVAVGT
jgi:hypothetical protein